MVVRETVQIFVRHKSTCVLDGVCLAEPVGVLLDAWERKCQLPSKEAWLSFEGRCLSREKALREYSLSSGATLQLALRGRGGGCSLSSACKSDVAGTVLGKGKKLREAVKLGRNDGKQAQTCCSTRARCPLCPPVVHPRSLCVCLPTLCPPAVHPLSPSVHLPTLRPHVNPCRPTLSSLCPLFLRLYSLRPSLHPSQPYLPPLTTSHACLPSLSRLARAFCDTE